MTDVENIYLKYILDRMAKEGLSDEVTIMLRSKGYKGVSVGRVSG